MAYVKEGRTDRINSPFSKVLSLGILALLRLSSSHVGIIFCCSIIIISPIRVRHRHLLIQPIQRLASSLAFVNHLPQHAHAAPKLLRQLIHVLTANNPSGRATAARRTAEVCARRLCIGGDSLALYALDAEHHRRRGAFVILAVLAVVVTAVLLERELRRRDGKVRRQAGCPRDGPFAGWVRGRREIDDEGAVRRVGLRGGEHGGGVVVAEEVVDARVDGGVCGGVCQEGEDGLEGGDVVGRGRRRWCVVAVVDDVAVAGVGVVVMLLILSL